MAEEVLQKAQVIQRQQIHRDMPGLDVCASDCQKTPPLPPADPLAVIAAAADRSLQRMPVAGHNIEKYNCADNQKNKAHYNALNNQDHIKKLLLAYYFVC
jgi:hypothetical protein